MTSSSGINAPKRAPRRWIFVAIGLLLLLAAGGAYAGWTLAGEPRASTSTSPMPSRPVLNEQAACVLAVPAAADGAKQVLAVAQGEEVDWDKMQKAHDRLKLAAEISEPTMREDINQQVALLSQLLASYRNNTTMTMQLSDFRSSGLRIGNRCMQYAS